MESSFSTSHSPSNFTNLQLSPMTESSTPISRLASTRYPLYDYPENLPSSSSFSFFSSPIPKSRPPSHAENSVPSSSSFSYFSSPSPPVSSGPQPKSATPSPSYTGCDVLPTPSAPLPGLAPEYFDFDLAHLGGMRRQYPLKRKRIDDADEVHARISPKRFQGPGQLAQ
ncbi:hypothetical protein MSAN_01279800 [Mycena sanguinolenta]|uniref:Uncharacterized protein n=1 Tax=Mycena sanguinolenta TaxID=230812 RepID=A0A8H6YHT8_9AGAR|nr:hypothetical protein MSAN_01279800 [Mycena sanguinolenta]